RLDDAAPSVPAPHPPQKISAAHQRGHQAGGDFLRKQQLPAQPVRQDHDQCTNQRGGQQLARRPPEPQQVRQVGRDQTDEGQRTDHQRRQSAEYRGQQQEQQPCPLQRHPQRPGGRFSQREQIQPAAQQKGQRQQKQRQRHQESAARRRGVIGGAGQPGRDLLPPGIAIGQQQAPERLVQRAQGHARQQDALRRELAAAVQQQDQQQRGAGAGQRHAGQRQIAGLVQQEHAQHQGDGAAAADAQQLGAGHGIAGEALQNGTRHRQQETAAARREHTRQPPRQAVGAERGLPLPAIQQLPPRQGQQRGQHQRERGPGQ